MKTIGVSIPELGFVAVTRGIAGAGVGLLLAECIEAANTRRAIGWTLLAIGALTTIPIAWTARGRYRDAPGIGSDQQAA